MSSRITLVTGHAAEVMVTWACSLPLATGDAVDETNIDHVQRHFGAPRGAAPSEWAGAALGALVGEGVLSHGTRLAEPGEVLTLWHCPPRPVVRLRSHYEGLPGRYLKVVLMEVGKTGGVLRQASLRSSACRRSSLVCWSLRRGGSVNLLLERSHLVRPGCWWPQRFPPTKAAFCWVA